MWKSSILRWPLMGVVGTIGLFAGLTPQMDPEANQPVQAGDISASSSARATSRSSGSTSNSRGACHSATSSSAEVTTVINGETRTVRQEDTDSNDECGGRSGSKAKAAIDDSKPEDGKAGQ